MITSRLLKFAFLLSLFTVFYACNTDELENKIADLEAENLENVDELGSKEEVIVDLIGSMNEIQENLAKIKERENLMSANFDKGNVEIDNNMKDQLIGDIELINNLLLDNKKKMAALNAKLKKSNLKIVELEKMIERMAVQLQEKDAQIAALQTQLAEANQQLKVIFQEYNNRIEELGDKEDKLNTAYYCYGSAKELQTQGVITKEGGFIGIGKTQKLSSDFNKDYFTKVDISLTKDIQLMSKKVKIITNHPSNSYKIEGPEGKAEKLVILDAAAFWASSKYLVMVVE